MITLTKEQRIAIVRYRMEKRKQHSKGGRKPYTEWFYNTAVNRMYYACYYAASAILIAKGVETKSHDGVRRIVGQELVLKGVIDAEYERLYSQLSSKRDSGDYEDFINHDLRTVESLFPIAKSFVAIIDDSVNRYLT